MRTLHIVSLTTPDFFTRAAEHALQSAKRVFVQTAQSPCIQSLAGVSFEAMDDLYAAAPDFDALNSAIIERLLEAVAADETVCYVVFGRLNTHVKELLRACREQGIQAAAIPGTGFAEAAAARACIVEDSMVIATANVLPGALDTSLPLAVEEIDTALRAGEVKLHISEFYPDTHRVLFCSMERNGDYTVTDIPLYELDRQSAYNAATVLLVPPLSLMELTRYGYAQLVEVMRRLRAPGGCPWDAEQTHESLKKTMIEECYEALDAIDKRDDDALCEELGDVLLQCVFHAAIAEEQGRFTERDICTGIVKKLIYRHPHIFASAKIDTADEVVVKWEELKKKEKHFATQAEVLAAVPNNLPALMRAYKVQKKAAQVGFDWSTPMEAFPKIAEETEELSRAMRGDGSVEEEIGDLLFAVVNVARLLKADPEELLQRASSKFIGRFTRMEALAALQNAHFSEMSLPEMDKLWNQVKN
ncbi:nucleoside triphosphate pyrophosphohydrolase [Christensenellaceae bacterium OttesenSCG-928-L17]|nr:nucleoside triphosphate pyrophosphohydrolase [Christensenellaceae bacterium OttesenSCG-928-L17]